MIVVTNEEEEERIERAREILDGLRRMARDGYFFILGSDNTFKGVGYMTTVAQTDYGRRTVIHLVTRDGRPAKIYADLWIGSSLEPVIALDFHREPFILITRRTMTLKDDLDDVVPVMVGTEAKPYAELLTDYKRLYAVMKNMEAELREKDKIIENYERKIRELSERVRDLEKEVDDLSRENVALKNEFIRLKDIAESALASEASARDALNQIKVRVDKLGMGYWVTRDSVEDYIKESRKIRDLFEVAFSPNSRLSEEELKRVGRVIVEELLNNPQFIETFKKKLGIEGI